MQLLVKASNKFDPTTDRDEATMPWDGFPNPSHEPGSHLIDLQEEVVVVEGEVEGQVLIDRLAVDRREVPAAV